MTDDEQSSNKQPKNESSTSEQLIQATQPAFTELVIDDEREYTTREVGNLLNLHPQTIISHIKRKNITAERRIETRGPVYYITGAEIRRFKRERRSPGSPGKRSLAAPEPPQSESSPHPTCNSANETNIRPTLEE